jgi:hypothetical protein
MKPFHETELHEELERAEVVLSEDDEIANPTHPTLNKNSSPLENIQADSAKKPKRGRPRKTIKEDIIHEKEEFKTTAAQAPAEKNSSEVNGSDPEKHTRPQRTRRQPERLGIELHSYTYEIEAKQMEPKRRSKTYSNKILLSSVFMLLMCILSSTIQVEAKGKIIHKGEVIFQERSNMAFSKSEWTLITTFSWAEQKQAFLTSTMDRLTK